MASDTANKFVLDTDEGREVTAAEPEEIPHVTTRIAGEEYEAYCPKDWLWLKVHGLDETSDPREVITVVMSYLDGAFLPEDQARLEKRFRNPLDPLDTNAMLRSLKKINKHFEPVMVERFEAMGIEWQAEAVKEAALRAKGGRQKPQRKTGGKARQRAVS